MLDDKKNSGVQKETEEKPKAKDKPKGFEKPDFIVSVGPHIRSKDSISKIMWITVAALLPAAGWAVYIFGMNALFHIVIAVFTCILVEIVMKLFRGTRIMAWDGSAAVTGILIAFNLPYNAPFYVTIIACVFAIAVVKEFFGGLGTNFINPALAGRAFVMFANINHMSNNKLYQVMDAASSATSVDTVTRATPMSALAYFNKGFISGDHLPNLWDLFIGKCSGSMGEISALLLILGGLFLLYKGYIRWQIPVFFIGTVMLFSFLYAYAGGVSIIKPEYSPAYSAFIYSLYHLVSGGLMLGAWFMATDMVTTPVTRWGNVIFGVGCGLITSLIRIFGQYPEGVMFSILLMNIATPLITRLIKPRIYGTQKGSASRSTR